jgi:hypothetical protein
MFQPLQGYQNIEQGPMTGQGDPRRLAMIQSLLARFGGQGAPFGMSFDMFRGGKGQQAPQGQNWSYPNLLSTPYLQTNWMGKK